MSDILKRIIENDNIENIIEIIINDIYENGPVNRSNLEILSFIKFFHPTIFVKYEEEIINIMGLFFKNVKSSSLKSSIMQDYGASIYDSYGQHFTPIQMDIVNNVNSNKYFSFSAATSTGKSYVFRDLLLKNHNDIIIIVPSRALINEYYIKVKEIFKDNKVNILTYIDFINRSSNRRNIFIVTPERAKELFKYKDLINLDLVLFDEAQLSDEKGSRGIIFDSLVRRIKKSFPNTKMLFAFPYISNPNAQLVKNHMTDDISNYHSYKEKNVGQMFFSMDDEKFYAFGVNKEIMGNNRVPVKFDPIKLTLEKKGSVLVYTSKSKILNEKVLQNYSKYCECCEEITDSKALKLIKKFDQYMGTSGDNSKYGYSQMSFLLRRGIILHHGSLPLKARMIIEELTKMGFCNLCFSTSTLVQGINMPFDIVVLDRFENKPLEMKNLIGRAGRSSLKPEFDYGIVIIKDSNKRDLRKILNSDSVISAESLLDTNEVVPEDVQTYKEALLNDTFNDEYNLPIEDVNKITKQEVLTIAENLIELLFDDDNIITERSFSQFDRKTKDTIYDYFKEIYKFYLSGRELSKGEKCVLSNCVKILLWQIHGKTFKQIVGYRYANLRRSNDVKKLLSKYRNKVNIQEDFEDELNNIKVVPTMKCSDIPNKNLGFIPLFEFDLPAYKVSYDLVAFDTYDYIDKIINFKLKDIYYAVFNELYIKKNDVRAKKMSLYIKYGSADDKEIMLLRYGFDFETIEWLIDRIEKVDENQIIFKDLDLFSDDELLEIDNYL